MTILLLMCFRDACGGASTRISAIDAIAFSQDFLNTIHKQCRILLDFVKLQKVMSINSRNLVFV